MKTASLLTSLSLLLLISAPSFGQLDSIPKPGKPKEINPLKYNLNEDGSHFFQVTFLNQAWFRYNESNPGTTVQGTVKSSTADIGLRRTRIQMYGQLTDRVFLYFQFGQNNFNSQYNVGANRKNAAFFHDALCEYKVSNGNQLILGGGLTIANGLSRFSQPSIGTIMTMDVPVFAQATVDQTDEFSRKLSVYARGQVGKLDYRLVLSDPFPIASNGQPLPALSKQANFSRKASHFQYQSYLQWQFLEKEGHQTPYMTGTYLGKKKIFNIGAGMIYQPKAMWKQGNSSTDTVYQDMVLWSAEAFYDAPVNKEKGTALSAYLGYFNYNYGTNYLRYNGLMNPANGFSGTGNVTGSGGVFGNAFPMFGTGQIVYGQLGYLLPSDLLGSYGSLMPYVSGTYADWKRLDGQKMVLYNAGVNWFINGHKSKITLDWQSRPVFSQAADDKISTGSRKNCFVLQYQIFL